MCLQSNCVSLSVTDCWWGKECLFNTQSQPQPQPRGSRKTPVSEREVWREDGQHAVCLFMPSKTNYLIHIHVQYTRVCQSVAFLTQLNAGPGCCISLSVLLKTFISFLSFHSNESFSQIKVLHSPDEQMASGGVTTHLWRSGDTDCLPWLSQPLWRASSATVGPPR